MIGYLARDFAQSLEKAYPDLSNDKLKHKQAYTSLPLSISTQGKIPPRGAEALEQLIERDPLDGLVPDLAGSLPGWGTALSGGRDVT